MRFLLPTRRIWRAAIYLICLALVFLAILMAMTELRRSIHPGFDTTRIIAPLQQNGAIDYLTAIEEYFGRGVTNENNAAPLIFRALGRKALPDNQPEDGITNRLGMPHLPEQGDYYVTFDEFMNQHPAEDDPDVTAPGDAIKLPVAFKPATEAWVKANEKPLAILSEAALKTRFYIPFNGGHRTETILEVRLSHVPGLRDARRALLTRALMRFQAGNFEGFRADVLTVMRLARLTAQSMTMVERMEVANRLESAACTTISAAATSGKLSAKQAQLLGKDLEALGDLGHELDTFNVSERYLVLDTLQVLARAGPVHAGGLINAAVGDLGGIPRINPVQFWRFVPIPYEDSMRSANHAYDGAMAVMAYPTFAERARALDEWEKRINQIAGGNKVYRMTTPDWLLPAFMPAIATANRRAESVLMENRLARVSLALAAFKAEHGTYPTALAELVPASFPSIPFDSFSGKPLVYSRSGDGYSLYSVGPNMTDDAGKSTKPGDDLVVRAP